MFNSPPPPPTYDDLPDYPDEETVALSHIRRRVVTPPLPVGRLLSSTKKMKMKKNTSAVTTAAASKPLLGAPKDQRRLSPSSLFSPSKFFTSLNKSVEHELDGMKSEDEDDEDEFETYQNTFRVSDDVNVSGKENMKMSVVQPKIDFWNRGGDGKTMMMMTPTNSFKKTPKQTATSPAKVTPLGRNNNNNNNGSTPMSKNSGYDGDYDDEEGNYSSWKKNGPSPLSLSSSSMMGLKSFDSLAVQRGGLSFGGCPIPAASMKGGFPPLKEVTIVNDGTDPLLDLPTPKMTNVSFSFPDDADPKISTGGRPSGDECCNHVMGGLVRSFGSLFFGFGRTGRGYGRRQGYQHMQNDVIWFPEEGGEQYSKLYNDGEDDSGNYGTD